MNPTRMIIVPNIMFEGRRIAIQAYGPVDKEGDKLAIALSQILQKMLMDKRADDHPIIVSTLGPGRSIGKKI